MRVDVRAGGALVSVLAATLGLLETQRDTGAPLDAILNRHARTNKIAQADRMQISALLDDCSKSSMRLDHRLGAAGVEPAPRSRLLASLKLNSEMAATDIAVLTAAADVPALTADEATWLDALSPPLENDGMNLRTRLECPEWAWPHFEAAFGDRVEPELRALLETPPLDLRVNTLKTTRDDALDAIRAAGFAAEPTPYSPVGIRLAERSIPLGTIPGLLEGAVDPQDEGSQLVALLVGARPGEVVADYCAGSGGKTLALAAEMDNRGRLVAMDIDDARLGRSAPRHTKAGVDNVQRHLIVTDGKDAWLKRRKRSFDRVLVDAPCSGVGAWRRNPDARGGAGRKTRPLDELLPVQADVLQRAARLCRPGGTLVYATCSLLGAENDDQVAAFLASDDGADFELRPPEEFHVPLDGDVLRLTPARHGCDGFFAAVLQRKEGGWSRRSRS